MSTATLKSLGLIGAGSFNLLSGVFSTSQQQQQQPPYSTANDEEHEDSWLNFHPEHADDNGLQWCPCPPAARNSIHRRRYLEDATTSGTNDDAPTWQVVYTCVVLVVMFLALISDKFGSDSVMIAALTAFMAAEIITVSEGLEGFANPGLLTVLILFVVAEGIARTGALDWYMGKLLGNPQTPAAAQLRLMAPVAVVSAFLNNTPVVAIMIPIVQRWAKQIRVVSAQQLLIPLSFASILGGTCTLIGTSTNLVVVGLLEERYPNDPDLNIGLFDLGEFGVPVAMAGISYILLMSPFLLPGGSGCRKNGSATGGAVPDTSNDDILLGARLTQWSPAAGRTIQRSGLRDTGGIYLVSVHRAATGNVHRAVSNDFVLNTGDILYFTGLVESFGQFCEEHGLEVVTNEMEHPHNNNTTNNNTTNNEQGAAAAAAPAAEDNHAKDALNSSLTAALDETPVPQLLQNNNNAALTTVEEDGGSLYLDPRGIPVEVGVTKESLLHADEAERMRSINRITDAIHGVKPSPDEHEIHSPPPRRPKEGGEGAAAKIVVTIDKDLVVVGIDAPDRAGLLLDIAKGLMRFNLQLRHTEAAVVHERSLSIWRCEATTDHGEDFHHPDVEEIWSVLNALLADDGIAALKQRGLRVIRARVLNGSRLVGKTAAEVNFRQEYKAAIVAIQSSSNSKTTSTSSSAAFSTVRFDLGDVLVLQASDDSPLLNRPPDDFYKNLYESMKEAGTISKTTSVGSLVRMLTRRPSKGAELSSLGSREELGHSRSQSGEDDDFFIGSEDPNATVSDEEAQFVDMSAVVREAEVLEKQEAVWKDLYVIFRQEDESGEKTTREFLTAMQVAPQSQLAGKNVAQVGIQKLPDLFLVSIDRPVAQEEAIQGTPARRSVVLAGLGDGASVGGESSALSSMRTEGHPFDAVDPEEPLREGDVLWFSGPASAVGDLRKIPGLVSYQNEEVEKITGNVYDRRLIQAVVARQGPLVGKTVKALRFRTRYGAAVIAVHREGKRVHEHPGNIKLQAGDVLLLEAGPSFIAKNASENDKSFVLLAEVEDSAPPRLSLLLPALLITAGMLAVFMAGLTSLLVSGLVASILMVALGILSEQEARDAVKWDIYITIASAFGIGIALINSGVADAIAEFMVDIGTAMGIGDAGLVGAVYFATFLISNVVTNNAAAALLFPIAMNAAEQTGVSILTMSYSLMLGASASFMSPYGYTTNLLVFGPGGYSTMDFVKFGSPMQIVLGLLTILYLSVIKTWYISWISTGLCLVVIAVSRMGAASISSLWPRKKQVQESAAALQ